MTNNPNNLLLAIGLMCLLAGLQSMFGLGNVMMGWIGIAIGLYCLGLLLWRKLRKGKVDA